MRIKLNAKLYPSYNSKNLSDICETLSKQTVNPDGFEEFDIVDIHILVLLVTKVHAVHIRVIKTPLLYKFIRTWLKCKVYISMPSALTSTMLMENSASFVSLLLVHLHLHLKFSLQYVFDVFISTNLHKMHYWLDSWVFAILQQKRIPSTKYWHRNNFIDVFKAIENRLMLK